MTAGHLHREHAVAEPLGPPRIVRGTRDWTARRRATAREAERYSRFVTIMKRALPLAAVALIAAVLIYALEPRQERSGRVAMTFQRLGIVNDDLAMLKPRLSGADDQGDPYVVTAEEAIQDKNDSKRATLKNIQGDVSMKDGTWISALAPKGLLDAKNHRLALLGPIALYSDSGYEMHTASARINMRDATIVGDEAVTGQGPYGIFRADHFKLDRRTRQVLLTGNVRMTINAHGKLHS